MRVKKTNTGFTDKLIIGKFGFFIEVDDNGINIDNKDLIAQAIHFKCVVLYGKDVFYQKEEVSSFVKTLKKKNEKIEIIIFTNGFTRPIGLSNIDGIIFIIIPQMKNSNIEFEKRINLKILNWYSKVNSLFMFYVCNEDDIDEAMMLSSNLDIKRKNMYFVSKDNNIEFLVKNAKKYGINISVNIDDVFKIDEVLIQNE